MIDERLANAYRATSYWAKSPVESFRLRIGEKHPEWDATLHTLGIAEWAMVTAYNPRSKQLLPIENRERQERLGAEIGALGFACWPGENIADDGGWPAETSALVLGIGREVAMELARRFEQHAIVVGRVGEAAELVWV